MAKAAKQSKPSKAKKKAEPTAPPERQLRFKASPELVQALRDRDEKYRPWQETLAQARRGMEVEICGRPKRRPAPKTLKAWLSRTVPDYPHGPDERMTAYAERLHGIHATARKGNPRLRPTKSVTIAVRLYELKLGPRKRR